MTDLALTRGDSTQFAVAITRPDQDGVPQPVSLDGAALWFTLKLGWDAPDVEAIVQKTIGAGIGIVEPPTAGIAVVDLAPADTAALGGFQRYVYDVQLREADMTLTTVSSGYLIVERDATRATA